MMTLDWRMRPPAQNRTLGSQSGVLDQDRLQIDQLDRLGNSRVLRVRGQVLGSEIIQGTQMTSL